MDCDSLFSLYYWLHLRQRWKASMGLDRANKRDTGLTTKRGRCCCTRANKAASQQSFQNIINT